MGPGTLYGVQCCILVYTGLYWEAPPPPPGVALSSSFRPPKGEMGGNGGGGANFGVKSPLFGAFGAPLWGEKRRFGAKRRHLGAEVPNLGQNGLLFGVGAPQIWGKRFNFRSAFPNSGPKAAILG